MSEMIKKEILKLAAKSKNGSFSYFVENYVRNETYIESLMV